MCLAALLCQQFFPTCKWRCEDTDTLIRGSFALTKPCWLYSVFKCQNHNSWSAFANTTASPVNMALCRNVCIRSYFSRFFWRTRSLSRLNLSTCLPFVFVHRLVSVDHFLLHNIIHAKRWPKITWYLGAVLIPKHIYSTTSVVQEFFTEGKGESEHRIQLNKTTDNWPGICNFIVDLNLWLAYFKICLGGLGSCGRTINNFHVHFAHHGQGNYAFERKFVYYFGICVLLELATTTFICTHCCSKINYENEYIKIKN